MNLRLAHLIVSHHFLRKCLARSCGGGLAPPHSLVVINQYFSLCAVPQILIFETKNAQASARAEVFCTIPQTNNFRKGLIEKKKAWILT